MQRVVLTTLIANSVPLNTDLLLPSDQLGRKEPVFQVSNAFKTQFYVIRALRSSRLAANTTARKAIRRFFKWTAALLQFGFPPKFWMVRHHFCSRDLFGLATLGPLPHLLLF